MSGSQLLWWGPLVPDVAVVLASLVFDWECQTDIRGLGYRMTIVRLGRIAV